MVNATPYQLNKRDLTFTECAKQPPTSVKIDVSVSPGNIVPGGTNTFTVSGSLLSDITTGAPLNVSFFRSDNTTLIDFTVDICETTGVTCPVTARTQFSTSLDVPISVDFPTAFAFVVRVVIGDVDQNTIGCATASSG